MTIEDQYQALSDKAWYWSCPFEASYPLLYALQLGYVSFPMPWFKVWCEACD